MNVSLMCGNEMLHALLWELCGLHLWKELHSF